MKTIRRAMFALVVVVLLGAPTPGMASFVDWLEADEPVELGATQVISRDRLRLGEAETVPGDVYATVGSATVNGTIIGDLSIFTAQLDVKGTITSDLNVAAQKVALADEGRVGDDFRAFAVDVTLFGEVGGDAFVSAVNRVDLSEDTIVSGALAVSAPRVVLRGRIEGPVRVTAGLVEINGTLAEGATIECDTLKFGPFAQVMGDLVYDARSEISGSEDFVSGEVRKVTLRDRTQGDWFQVELPDFGIWFDLYLALVALLAGTLFLLFFRPIADGALGQTAGGAGLAVSFGIGVVAVLVMLMLGAVCLFTLPLGLAIWAALGALLYFGGLIGKMMLGCLLLRPILRRQCHPLLALLVGVIVLFLLGLIPVAGPIIWLLVTVCGMGATMLQLRHVRSDPATVESGGSGPPSPPAPAMTGL